MGCNIHLYCYFNINSSLSQQARYSKNRQYLKYAPYRKIMISGQLFRFFNIKFIWISVFIYDLIGLVHDVKTAFSYVMLLILLSYGRTTLNQKCADQAVCL